MQKNNSVGLFFPLSENLQVRLPFIKKSLNLVPLTAGVYFYFNSDDKLIYIGKAKSLRFRLRSYFIKNIFGKNDKLTQNVKYLSYIAVSSEIEALILEAGLIQKYKPYYNIAQKDDKSPSYVYITDEKYPRVILKRMRENFSSKVKFGPFINSGNLKYILRELRRIVPYCDHPQTLRPCIYYQMGLCNPCPAIIDSESNVKVKAKLIKDYKTNVRNIKLFFGGNFLKFKKMLEKQMEGYSHREDFESAEIIRRRLTTLSNLLNPNYSPESYTDDPYFLKKLRRREIKDFRDLLAKHDIRITKSSRIECYDISHFHGTFSSGSMVVMIGGETQNAKYRHFCLRTSQNNDYESMKEIGKRRKNHFSDWGKPDLIIVDGGKSQISAFVEIFDGTDTPIVGISKRMEELIIPTTNGYQKIRLNGPKLALVQRIRNEAHRFAQRYHHKQIQKNLSGGGIIK